MSQLTHQVTPLFGSEKPFHATSAEVETMRATIANFATGFTVEEISKPLKPTEPADAAPVEFKTKTAAAPKGNENAA